jgi:hypothetical protein
VARLLGRLEELGYLAHDRQRARSIRLTGKLPVGFAPTLPLSTSQHEMWAIETDRRDMPGTRIVQALSLCFFKSELPSRLRTDPTTNPQPVRVRVTIERID